MSATPPADRSPWHEVQPERLNWELEQFAERGLPATVTGDGDPLVIETEIIVAEEAVPLRVRFPFDYPDVEPTVYGPENLLDRHQNRRLGNFCLLEDPTLDWWPTMSAAALVDEDLRWLIADSRGGRAAVAAGEADMPEPLSQHIDASSRTPVLVSDPFWTIELQASAGQLRLVEKALDGFVLSEAEGIGSADADLVKMLDRSPRAEHRGRWTALRDGALSPWPSQDEVLDAALAASSNLLALPERALRKRGALAHADGWVGVTFLEEGPRRGERRRGWVFLHVRVGRDGGRRVLKAARAMALTAGERARRIPELSGLAETRVLVVGGGSVGAPVVMELVKAGVGTIDIADYDVFDVNNTVRHVLDVRWAGNDKALALALEARWLNPFVTVKHHLLHVGETRTDSQKLDALIRTADVVVDATGSHLAARVIARRCKEDGKPMVLAALTAGSYGAEAVAFRPDGPCFWCFVLAQQDGDVPSPTEGPRSNTTPVGCSTPAFSGAGFDATALAATTARLVVQSTEKTAYPSSEFDYVVMNFRGPDAWRQGRLTTHPGCPLCQ